MVAISRHCPFLADKAVQISRAVFFFFFEKKDTTRTSPQKKAKRPYKSGYQIFFMPGFFEL